ncbi:hypothetical protein NQ317_018580 [Molorchus minor]|uniref:Uncharacterized protein n=1 Tax=Molorchus minor TaxID=1323400 RepID=A0ABQ9JY72_9CUCU|nr:hypothetical protein NQ317_018580 [Molorchus minor]
MIHFKTPRWATVIIKKYFSQISTNPNHQYNIQYNLSPMCHNQDIIFQGHSKYLHNKTFKCNNNFENLKPEMNMTQF